MAFSGSLAHPLCPCHLPRFQPSSRLPGGTQGHSKPPTTLSDAAGGGKGAQLLGPSRTQLCLGFFFFLSTPSIPIHPVEKTD